jgi:hypothetical protein
MGAPQEKITIHRRTGTVLKTVENAPNPLSPSRGASEQVMEQTLPPVVESSRTPLSPISGLPLPTEPGDGSIKEDGK